MDNVKRNNIIIGFTWLMAIVFITKYSGIFLAVSMQSLWFEGVAVILFAIQLPIVIALLYKKLFTIANFLLFVFPASSPVIFLWTAAHLYKKNKIKILLAYTSGCIAFLIILLKYFMEVMERVLWAT